MHVGSGKRGACCERKRTPLKRREASHAFGPAMIETAWYGCCGLSARRTGGRGSGDLNKPVKDHQRDFELISLSTLRSGAGGASR